MKRILVTGATGFIGAPTVPELLARGYEVHAVTSKSITKEQSVDVHWHQANLLDSDQIKNLLSEVKPTHLVHFAWFVEHGAFWTSLENFRWVQASLDLLTAFQENGGERAVLAGTCAEYDWKYGYCQEDRTPLNPASLYGTCKNALQTLLVVHAAQTGYSAVWGRIFFPFGPAENPKRLVPSVIRSLLHNQPALCSHGEQIRDFLYVEDVARGFVALLESNVTGPVNIASGTPLKIKEIVQEIARQMNTPDLIQLGALPPAPNDPPLLLADVSRIKNEVSWQTQINLETAIEKTINWWREQLELTHA